MNNPAEKTLYRTAAVIFEEMGFLLPIPGDAPIGDSPAAGASVSFSGPFSGMLIVRVTRDALPVLSTNMLGEPAPADARVERDALGEVANVICGNVLPAIAGPDTVFHLKTPLFFDGEVPARLIASHQLRADAHITLECGRADVMLYVA